MDKNIKQMLAEKENQLKYKLARLFNPCSTFYRGIENMDKENIQKTHLNRERYLRRLQGQDINREAYPVLAAETDTIHGPDALTYVDDHDFLELRLSEAI